MSGGKNRKAGTGKEDAEPTIDPTPVEPTTDSQTADSQAEKTAEPGATSTTGSKKWTLRGVPTDIRASAIRAAKEAGKPVGDLVTEALSAYLDELDGAIEAGETDEAEIDPLEKMEEMARYFDERLRLIERRMRTVERDSWERRLVQRPWIRSAS